MKYISTRNKNYEVSGAEAIVKGISPDGGLFVPESFPTVSPSQILELTNLSYEERAEKIISMFLPEMADTLLFSATAAYSRFDGDPAPLLKLDDSLFMLELWHGPTFAFKDIALTLLPRLMTAAKKILGDTEKTLILVATSGDTGKAALEGFKDVDGAAIAVLYPSGGVSNLQKLQMMTQTGENVFVSAIHGNFDDAQTAVKNVFADKEIADKLLAKGIKLSSANSINWGRLVPQIVYYFSAYADMVSGGQIKNGQKVNFCVPSGNFGNILAGWYAKQMGLPIAKLICASNVNNVLTDFFGSGEYNAAREFYKTTSPSMDILVSSNLERLIFELSGRNDTLTASRMLELKTEGSYGITNIELALLGETFWAGYANDDAVADTIDAFMDEYGYIADPHTAVALEVYNNYVAETGDNTPTVVVSTASPYKFVDDVLAALGEKPGKTSEASMKKLENLTALEIPEALSDLPKMEKIYTGVIDKADVAKTVLAFAEKLNA